MAHELMHLLDDKYKLSKRENIVNGFKGLSDIIDAISNVAPPLEKGPQKILRKRRKYKEGNICSMRKGILFRS